MIAWTRGRIASLGAALALAAPLCAQPAEASRFSRHAGYQASGRIAARVIYAGASHYSYTRAAYRGSYSVGGLQCVPFARENTGIELAGNAANWWDNATGVYERGAKPEVGSILNFRATGRMRMGHVAVVSNVVNSRSVQIDHANWSGRGVVTRNVTVVDVSPAGDWSAVRVALGNGDFGSIYPTFGFIYDRPDRGTMTANAGVTGSGSVSAPTLPAYASARAAPAPAILDLRPAPGRMAALPGPQAEEEVAEAADDAAPRRSHARSLPVVHYGRGTMQMARPGRGDMQMAQLGRGMERMTSGRMMGGQVLFIGRTAPRGTVREASNAGAARGYTGLVHTAAARGARQDRAQAPVVRLARGQADTGHRRGRRT